MEKTIDARYQRGDLVQDEEGDARLLQQPFYQSKLDLVVRLQHHYQTESRGPLSFGEAFRPTGERGSPNIR